MSGRVNKEFVSPYSYDCLVPNDKRNSFSSPPQSAVAPTPFLRWAGGKRKLAETIISSFPKPFNPTENNFFEPFVGGGALSLHLGNKSLQQYVPGKKLFINDLNPDLITTYKVIQQEPEQLMKKLKSIAKELNREEFDRIRASRPTKAVEIAARFIYLNKTCFNGLWRVNSKGEFNVPWGKLKNPLIYNKSNIESVSERLQGATITSIGYAAALSSATKDDLVYLDPPYIPLNQTSSFSKYAKEDFGILEQYALAGVIDGLTSRGVHVILSNSDTALTRKIFGDSLTLHQMSVTRSISANSSSRIKVQEIIGVNFNVTSSSLLHHLRIVS
jgi:DNA adenine methylase